MSEQQAMSRAARTARGAFGALVATMLAATSHALAGGAVTPIAVLATALFALPLCVLLAGRVGSLWRLALAVVGAQFVYHWSFSGLGLVTSTSDSFDAPVSPHAAHLGMLPPALFSPEVFSPEAVGAHSAGTAGAIAADALMWAAHAVAAILTITLMHRGEQGVIHLVRVVRGAVPVHVPAAVRLPVRPAILEFFTTRSPRVALIFLSTISHRGPPRVHAFVP